MLCMCVCVACMYVMSVCMNCAHMMLCMYDMYVGYVCYVVFTCMHAQRFVFVNLDYNANLNPRPWNYVLTSGLTNQRSPSSFENFLKTVFTEINFQVVNIVRAREIKFVPYKQQLS